MPSFDLDLQALRRLDALALEEAYRIIARSWGRQMTPEEVRRIYREGIHVTLTGEGLYHAPELNYALFVTRVGRALPMKWTICCVSGNGSAHTAILNRLDRSGLIAAGSVVRDTFAGLSSTWIVHDSRLSGRYSLGLFINDAVLACYRIPRYETVPPRSRTA
jgi:hypothetical protein